MMLMKGRRIPLTTGLMQLLIVSSVLSQTNATLPLNYKQVQDLWETERPEPPTSSLKGLTSQAVTARGVLFEVDLRREEDMKKTGMPAALINLIKANLRAGTLTVRCEPVECKVSINDEVVGETSGSEFTKS